MYRRTALAAAAVAALALTPGAALAAIPAGPGSLQTPTAAPDPDPPAPTGLGGVAIPPAPPTPPVAPTTDLLPGPQVDEDAFEDAIVDRMTGAGQPVGFAYAITRNGQLVAADGVGDARMAADGQKDFTPSTRIEVMSVSKPMGAIALQKILHKRGISVDTPIGSYLPSNWDKGPGFAAGTANPVTFRHLLTHTSGFKQFLDNLPDDVSYSNSWDGMKLIASEGTTPGGTPKYKNANYTMIRVLIARLAGWFANGSGPLALATENNHARRYLRYLNKQVFSKAGVAKVTCWEHDDDEAALVYNRDNTAIGGALVERDGDDRKHCGGHQGLHLSALDIVRVATYLRHTENLLPAPARTQMFDDRLGWNSGSNSGSNTGMWWHGGDGTFGGGRQVHTCIAALPQGYEASLVINSQYPSGGSQCGKLLDAYRDAV